MSIIIDYDRLAAECLLRCDELSTYTESPGQITRRFLTAPMRDVHAATTRWMDELNMTSRVDAVGNLIGTRSSAKPNCKMLLIGSHLDTVPNAGKYDGILGVIVGIAVVKALASADLPFAIDVVGFSEEEGVRFSTPYLGSRAIAGDFDVACLDLVDSQGHSLRAAIENFDLTPDEIALAAYPADRVLGFIETHIEQGPVLAILDKPVAVVSAIAGQSRLKICFQGNPGHAGTTPMFPRADALVAAARFIVSVSELAQAIDGLRATVGYVKALPNVRNVIPGEVEVSLDVRHTDDQSRLNATEELCKLAKQHSEPNRVACRVTERQDQPASAMDERLSGIMSQSISDTGAEPFCMLSGAGHDAVAMSDRFPSTMLFIRQPSGISHHPDEDVQQSDIAVAIEVITNFVRRLAIHESQASSKT